MSAMRAAVGLSALKPSEMIEGLDKAAERAEKQEQRESERRKAGGAAAVNTALHVDDTGKRWSRQIKVGIAAAASVIVLALGMMIYFANKKDVDPRQANKVTQDRLNLLRSVAGQIKPFTNDDDINVEKVKARLHEKIDAELADVESRLKALREARRPVDELARTKQELTELHALKDGWGKPFDITLPEADTLQIAVQAGSGESLPPVMVKIRKKK